jgi:hypothetical protein
MSEDKVDSVLGRIAEIHDRQDRERDRVRAFVVAMLIDATSERDQLYISSDQFERLADAAITAVRRADEHERAVRGDA